MKRFIPAVVGLVFGFTAAAAFAADGSTSLRRTTRLDLLADRSEVAAVDDLTSPADSRRMGSTVRLGGLDPVVVVAPFEEDTSIGTSVLGGMVIEGHRVPSGVKQAPVFQREKLDRIALDSAELAEIRQAKTPTSRPVVDRVAMQSKY